MVVTQHRQDADKGPMPATSAANTITVRRFVAEDIPQVATLHQRVFAVPDIGQSTMPGQALSPQLQAAYEAYFNDVFLDGPCRDDRIGSLVCEEGNGRIIGFLGVVPKQMSWNGAPIRLAVCSQFVVDPRRRGIVGLRLLAEHFKGPQDLSVTDEANEGTRRVWEARGGSVCPSYCVHWTRVLRPAGFALSVMSRRRRLKVPARGCAPVARLVDAVASRWRKGPFRPPAPDLTGEDLDESVLLAALPEFTDCRSLRPQYDHRSWNWSLERAGFEQSGSDFYKIAVRDDSRQLVGWYIYQVSSTGLGEVLQIAARPRLANDVFGHLLHHAWRHRVIALAGRLDPLLFKEISVKYCLFHFDGSSVLVHAKRPELLQALYRGDAFFTRLEGEWCLRFRPPWQASANTGA